MFHFQLSPSFSDLKTLFPGLSDIDSLLIRADNNPLIRIAQCKFTTLWIMLWHLLCCKYSKQIIVEFENFYVLLSFTAKRNFYCNECLNGFISLLDFLDFYCKFLAVSATSTKVIMFCVQFKHAFTKLFETLWKKFFEQCVLNRPSLHYQEIY